ncbi:MAG: hypothetical protein ACLGIA_11790 [Actinomycetes bacterium]
MTTLLSPRTAWRFSCSWRVDTLTRQRGRADVERLGAAVHVRVLDTSCGGDGTAFGYAATEAWLQDDGRLVVRAFAAPPALLVTVSGARLLPAPPETECEVEASDGDIVVMCSAEALGYLPNGLGAVLARSPLRVGATHPAALLEALMDGSPCGAALVARCVGD